MKGSKYNIKFNYLYRDAGNYKIFGYVIFHNQKQFDSEEIERVIRDKLIDREFFYPSEWKVPVLTFDEINEEFLPVWNEFENIEFTDENETDDRSFGEFLEELELKKTSSLR